MNEGKLVELAAHDPAWAGRAGAEIERLRSALGDVVVAAHHIGSTAVPGIMAKPTVDLMLVVRSLAAIDGCEMTVRGLGYNWRGEFGIPGRRFCSLDDANGRRVLHAHFYAAGNSEIEANLAFRDYMRSHADEARAYQREKIRAATLHPDDRTAYTNEKAPWVSAKRLEALEWARRY